MKLNVDVYLHFANSASFPIDVKIKNLDFGKGLLGRLWLFAYGMWSFLGGLRSFVCGLWLFSGGFWGRTFDNRGS